MLINKSKYGRITNIESYRVNDYSVTMEFRTTKGDHLTGDIKRLNEDYYNWILSEYLGDSIGTFRISQGEIYTDIERLGGLLNRRCGFDHKEHLFNLKVQK